MALEPLRHLRRLHIPDLAAEKLRLSRTTFVPAPPGARPYAILGLKVVVETDDEHTQALALPWYLTWVRGRAELPSELMSVAALR